MLRPYPGAGENEKARTADAERPPQRKGVTALAEDGGFGWGPLALVAAPACCGGAAWLATAGLTTGAVLAWGGFLALAAVASLATVALLVWHRRRRRSP